MLPALLLIAAAAGYRVLAVHHADLANVAPIMALAFCGGVYLRPKWWGVPFAALALSDLWLNHLYATAYGYGYSFGQMTVRAGCFAAALGIGCLVARRKNAINLLSGALGGSLIFYLATNTASWAGDAFYARTFAGWWQALTVGHPQFPPTLAFFRNTLVGDMLFTGLFVTVMEFAAHRAGCVKKAEGLKG